ncbi:neprilysin-2-like [Aphidius gifuensis]|uniref:neprilysin-2-like n=1 Tax=Aphidius gifuensis TaxID=684658 RepID=UPI001CDB779C|nr:neprilysin-2-like [Aphidius gifuensis]
MKQKILYFGILILQSFDIICGLPNEYKLQSTNAPCSTSTCQQTAKQVMLNMNNKIDPCENFYKFACGGFLESTIIPKDETQVNARSELNNKIDEQIRTMLDKKNSNEIKSFKLAKDLYEFCMNTSAIEEQGLQPYIELIKQKGGWPVLNNTNWNETELNTKKSKAKFFTIKIDIDVNNSTKKIIVIDQPTLGLSEKYFSKGIHDKIVNAYYNYMVDIAVIFGANEQQAQVELKKVLLLEMNIARIFVSSEKRRNRTLLHNPMTINEFTKRYPFIPLEYMLKKKFPSTIRMHSNEIIDVMVPSYFRNLEGVLNNVTARTMANYAMWKEVRSILIYLNEKIRNRQLDYLSTITGQTENKPRWKKCISIVKNYFPHAIGALYIKNYVDKNVKSNVEIIVMNIRNKFDELIKKADWMDDVTRQHALDKSKELTSYVGYPEELQNNSMIEELYNGLELTDKTLLGNIFILDKFREECECRKFRQPYDKKNWKTRMSPFIVNARYTPSENTIQLPAGILQGIFFNNKLPKYMNYGAIGFIIGHEITHGFDDKGRQFDKQGNLVEWWNPSTKIKFIEKAQCVIDQYNNYTVEEVGQNINGVNTQGENIADISGIKEAYLAYLTWTNKHGQEARILGLENYTPRQMFWISAANVRCKKMRLEALKNRVINNVHSPDEYRIIGPLSNMPEFSRDFNCPENSPMNSKNKCSIW